MAENQEEKIPGTEDYQEEDHDELYGEEEYVENGGEENAELEEMKKQFLEMEDEQDKMNKLQQQVEKQIHSAADSIDENSVWVKNKNKTIDYLISICSYIGQVDYEATTDDLRGHFAPCGTIKRITILCDKYTGHAKG